MNRMRVAIVGAVFQSCLAAAVWAVPLRLAIPTAVTAMDEAKDPERVAISLSLYLRESLSGLSSVRLVGERRAAAISETLRGGALDL